MALLAAVQWWWIRGLTGDLYDELDAVAINVGRSVASIIVASSQGKPDQIQLLEDVVEDVQVFDHLVSHCEEEPCSEKDEHRIERTVKFLYPDNPGEISAVVRAQGTTVDLKSLPPGTQAIVMDLDARSGPDGEASREVAEWQPDDVQAEDDVQVEAQLDLSSHRTLHIEHNGEARFLRLPGHRLRIPQEGMREKLEHFSRQMLIGTLAFLVIGLVLAALVAHRVSAPLRKLAVAAHEVGEGALGIQAPVPKNGGEVAQAVTAFNQMSERLAVLDAKTRELRTRKHLGEIGEIGRGLAHTLRNPLNALGLSVEELATRAATGEVEDPAHGLAASARRQIRRIDHSIRSFLALASQGGGAMAPVQVASLVQDVALEALQDAQGKVRLDLEGMETECTLNAVEPELRAVVQALLVNAVEASPQGAKVKVQLTEVEGERLRLEIDDEGPGLPDQVRARLFTPHLTTKANGSGMGLFLAHRIATSRYGGRLELEPRSGGGTRAVLEIGSRETGDSA